MNISGGFTVEVVDRFCFLGDMSSVDGSTEVAVMSRI